MSAHTPGPWSVQGRHSMEVSGPNGTHIVVDVGGSQAPNDHDAYATAQADARLIAAAPELLVLLQKHLAWFDGTFEPSNEREFIDATQAAIEKARGQ